MKKFYLVLFSIFIGCQLPYTETNIIKSPSLKIEKPFKTKNVTGRPLYCFKTKGSFNDYAVNPNNGKYFPTDPNVYAYQASTIYFYNDFYGFIVGGMGTIGPFDFNISETSYAVKINGHYTYLGNENFATSYASGYKSENLELAFQTITYQGIVSIKSECSSVHSIDDGLLSISAFDCKGKVYDLLYDKNITYQGFTLKYKLEENPDSANLSECSGSCAVNPLSVAQLNNIIIN